MINPVPYREKQKSMYTAERLQTVQALLSASPFETYFVLMSAIIICNSSL